MNQSEQIVTDNQVVALAYTLRLEDGEVIDQAPDEEPLEYLHGQGEILPGLEMALQGMGIGEEKQIEVQPADGYGLYDPEDFVEIPLESVPDDIDVVVGETLFVQDSENEHEYQAFIAEIGPDTVKLDFNHPLAGNTLYFDVKIVNLRLATAEEVSHGHAHTPGHEH